MSTRLLIVTADKATAGETVTGEEAPVIRRSHPTPREDIAPMPEKTATPRKTPWSVEAAGKAPARSRSSLRTRSGQRTATKFLRNLEILLTSRQRKPKAKNGSSLLLILRTRSPHLISTSPRSKLPKSKSDLLRPQSTTPDTLLPKAMRIHTLTPKPQAAAKHIPRRWFLSRLKTATKTENPSLSTTTSSTKLRVNLQVHSTTPRRSSKTLPTSF
jgi:hypothetical protein